MATSFIQLQLKPFESGSQLTDTGTSGSLTRCADMRKISDPDEDTSIERYNAKRAFDVTSEPRGQRRRAARNSPMFVIQKHAAQRAGLHWDFRLEHGGVLWSWAVPKGPSLDPADKRLAVHVEDHPIEYAVFEGTIPAEEYGGGSVETWDRGTWEPLSQPEEGMRRGELRFVLRGQRLHGRFTLTRLRRHPGKQEAWFLIKGHDEEARAGMTAATIDQQLPAYIHTRIVKSKAKKSIISPVVRQAISPPPKSPVPEPTVPVHAPVRIVIAKSPKQATAEVAGVQVTHPDRALWPGVTKRNLAEYWLAVANRALPGLARRPLAVLRAPDGIDKEHFFQKNGHGHLPLAIREGSVAGSPYLAIDDMAGLVALAQMSAIELHPWGASEKDPLHPDWLVFDLDPGDGIAFADVVKAAHEVRDRLKRLNLASFCRTTGGKGLHVVVPLEPKADWDAAKSFCRAFAELLAAEQPERYLAHLKIADRHGRILVDWLRNGMGSTAVSSYCPRARLNATVATPLAWSEVKPQLAPAIFTVKTVPGRIARQKSDPWRGFFELEQRLPDLSPSRPQRKAISVTGPSRASNAPISTPMIVVARKPKPH
jgi:bifunctional non-homologous end joining protein LigD